MRKITLVLALFMLVSFCYAGDIELKRGNNGFSVVADQSADPNSPRFIIKCDIARLTKQDVETEKGTFTRISIPQYQMSNEKGNPWVPMMFHLIEVPFGSKLGIRILSKTETEYSLEELGIKNRLMPCQPSLSKSHASKFSYNKKTYKRDKYSQYPLATIKEVGVIRSFRVASVQIAPILYNPVRKKLKVFNDIHIEIDMNGSDLQKTADIKNRYYSPYFEWTRSKFFVPQVLQNIKARTTSRPDCYLIVSDRMFQNELSSFIETKTAKGFHVEVAYTDEIGTTKEDIQSFIHDMYNNPTTERPAPTFLLFVGDVEHIPAFSGTEGSYITDLYYAAVTNDIFPDMYYGRFSGQTRDDVLSQVEKTIEYEQFRLPDPAFLERVVMIAGWDWSHAEEWGYPQINYGIENYFNSDHGYKTVDKFLSAGSHQNEQDIWNKVNAGASYVNYTAHGSSTSWSDPTFTKANIEELTNGSQYPLVVGNCCLTNKFEVETCFGEAWLRARNKGAIGYIGGSSYTYWDEDLWWGVGHHAIAHPNAGGTAPAKTSTKDGAYDGVFETGFFTNGAVIVAGNLAVEDSNSTLKKYYWEVYHLMGDPSVMIYQGIPTQQQVIHPTQFQTGKSSLVIEAEPGSYIGVSMNGKLHGAGVVDKSGKNSLEIKPFTDSGKAVIVVTKKNRIPYIENIQVTR